MRTYTDEQLVAYVDGELDDAAAREISVASAGDASLTKRIEVFTRSRDVLSAAFASKQQEPVPERLLSVLQASSRPARVRRWQPMALAASVALGLGIAFRFWQPTQPELLAFTPDAVVVTAALERNASGVPLIDEADGRRLEVVPLSTLRLRDGTWCREFDAAGQEAGVLHRATGVACRGSGGAWAVRGYAGRPQQAEPSPDGSYGLASGPSPDLTTALGPVERLNSTAEAAALSSHWEPR